MKAIFKVVCGAAWMVACGAFAAGLTAAQVADRNVAARGGLEAWRAVTTLSMSGEMDAGGKANPKLPFVYTMKRPHKSRLEIRFQDQAAVQVFDGRQGWKLRPYLNRNDVEPLTLAEARSAALADDLDGPLVDHARKGTKIEMAGMEKVDGRDTYKLKLSKKNGDVRHLWIDASTFLETKIDGEPRKLDSSLHTVQVYYGDYKKVGALTLPHALETRVEGVRQAYRMSVQNVAVNKPLEDAVFARTALASTAAAPQR